MCGDIKYAPRDPIPDKRSPEEEFSELIHRVLGAYCTPQELRMFIRTYWRRVSALAHEIHESDAIKASEAPR